jgi:hypothetical protein
VLERRFEDLTRIIKYFVQRDVVYVGIVNKMWDIKCHIVCIGRTETVLKTNAVLLKIEVEP